MLILLFVILTISLGIYQTISLLKIGNQLDRKASEIQISYQREIRLIDKLGKFDTKDYLNQCKETSNSCLYLGSGIRKDFLDNIKNTNFTDSDIEVLNMISSMDITVRVMSDEYNHLVNEYNSMFKLYPGVILKIIIKDKVTI